MIEQSLRAMQEYLRDGHIDLAIRVLEALRQAIEPPCRLMLVTQEEYDAVLAARSARELARKLNSI